MKLHLIIPYHGEPKDVYDKLLTSINTSVDVDFNNIEILICRSDGKNIFPDISLYPNLINRVTYLSHYYDISGPGISCNMGIKYIMSSDGTDEDYCLRVDIDDNFYSSKSLSSLYKKLMDNPDMQAYIFSSCWQDMKTNTSEVKDYFIYDTWTTAYNIKFLKENHILYPYSTSLYDCEYFTSLAQSCWDDAKSIANYNDVFYTHYINQGTSTGDDQVRDYNVEKRLQAIFNLWQEYIRWQERNLNNNPAPILYFFGQQIYALSRFTKITTITKELKQHILSIIEKLLFSAIPSTNNKIYPFIKQSQEYISSMNVYNEK